MLSTFRYATISLSESLRRAFTLFPFDFFAKCYARTSYPFFVAVCESFFSFAMRMVRVMLLMRIKFALYTFPVENLPFCSSIFSVIVLPSCLSFFIILHTYIMPVCRIILLSHKAKIPFELGCSDRLSICIGRKLGL